MVNLLKRLHKFNKLLSLSLESSIKNRSKGLMIEMPRNLHNTKERKLKGMEIFVIFLKLWNGLERK